MKDLLAPVVGGFKFDPDIESIHRAAGKEMPDFARAHDDLNTNRLAAPHGCADFIEWANDLAGRRDERRLRSEIQRLFAGGKGGCQSRLLRRASFLLPLARRLGEAH